MLPHRRRSGGSKIPQDVGSRLGVEVLADAEGDRVVFVDVEEVCHPGVDDGASFRGQVVELAAYRLFADRLRKAPLGVGLIFGREEPAYADSVDEGADDDRDAHVDGDAGSDDGDGGKVDTVDGH